MIRSVVILAGLVPLLLIAGCCNSFPGPFSRVNAPNTGVELCLEASFKQVDGNSDGVLDPTETAAPPMSLSSDFFDRIDENQDGVIDREEYEQMGLFVRCELCPTVDCPLGRSGEAGNSSTTP